MAVPGQGDNVRGDQFEARPGSSRFAFSLLLFLALMMTGVSAAKAGEFCSLPPFNGVVDGTVDYTSTVPAFTSFPTQITIDTDCTFQNFTASNPLTATLNFQTNDPSVYLITFNNVIFTGNMACANVDHRIWFVNGSDYGSNNSCQDLFIPVEAIDKQNPSNTTVGVGEPFTYTLTIPVLYDPVTGTYINGAGSANDLHSITITDDLNATGADLSLIGTPSVTWKGSGTPVPHTFSNVGGLLTFEILPIIPTGDQIEIAITVVLDDTPANVPGTSFVNTAKWFFGRLIEIDGVPTFFDPLPGEWGVTQPMTIGAPDLVITKTSPETALNIGSPATFTIDVQNNGGSEAWGATILDQLPDTADVGMCDFDPAPGLSAEIFAADGVTSVSGPLIKGIDYSVSYTGAPTCELSLTMQTAAAVIGPTQRLIITYQSELDGDTVIAGDGVDLINVAGATQWFSADVGNPRITYSESLTDGSPGISDFQDSHTITATLSGYVFQKTVQNLDSGANPATTAAPGDRLRYRLRLFNFTEVIDDVTFTDTLDPAYFDLTTFVMVTPPPAGATYTFNSGTGELQILGDGGPLNLTPPQELLVEFEIDLLAGLANGTVVPNQAQADAVGPPAITALSDDPFVNGTAAPGDPADSTDVLIQTPGPLSKVKPPQTGVTIGEQFTYTITVPATPVGTPLYDVRILDDLSASVADMGFVSAVVQSGGTWTLSNTGTSTSLVIEDTNTGIDIPANGQAVIEITVELLNTATNNNGLSFDNSASYTYNRSNGANATQTAGGSGFSLNMRVVEPDLTVTKVGTLITAAPVTGGSIIEYVVTMTNGGLSTAYNVNVVDNLPAELALLGSIPPTASIGGTPVVGFNPIPSPGALAGQLIWGLGNGDSSLDIPVGTSLILTYQAQVQISTVATFNNEAWVDWASLDISTANERTGDGCPAITAPDDYCATAISTPFNITDNNSLSKAVIADSWISGGSTAVDATVRIGDTATYQLTLNLGEGTTNSVTVSDVLPVGMTFDSLVSITPVSGGGSFDYTVVSQPAAGATGTLVWDLGDVINTPSNDGTPSDVLVIEYRVQVADNVLAQTPSTILNNTATLGYVDGAGNAVVDPARLESSASLTVLQPDLAMSKLAAPAGGDTIIVAGETITYTIDVINNGAGPAYDTVVQDILPVGLRQGGVTTTSITRVNTATNTVTATLANLAPGYVPATGTATWNFDNGVADDYTIPVGETLRIVYTVQADAGIGPGLTLSNAVTATLYYSFDDEAVPVNSVVNDREIYGPSNTAQTTLTTSPGAPLKENPVDPTVTIGQEFSYTITVPESPQPTALYDVQVFDDLGAIAADLTLVSIDNLSGGAWVPTNTGTASNLTIEDITTGIDIPANQQVVIGITLRLNNVGANIDTNTFTNSAAYTYNQVNGDDATQLNGGSSTTPVMTVVEPALSVTKVVSNATTGKLPADPITGGDILEYVVTINNGGNATAFDTNVADTLPPELALYGGFTPTATIGGTGVVGFVAIPAGAPTGQLIWGQGNGDGNLDIPAGGTLVLTYQTQVLASTAATFNNEVWVDWTSLEGASGFERTGAGCPLAAAPNNYCFGPVTVNSTVIDNNSLSKAVIADSWITDGSTALDATVRVGDTVSYRLTLNLGEGTTSSVTLSDVLPAGMVYDSLLSITPASGAGNFSYTIASQPAAGASGTLLWDFGTVSNTPSGDGTPTDALVIEYIARVIENDASTIAQAPSTVLNNTATLGYLDGAGVAVVDPLRLESQASITVLQPVMTAVSKTGNGITNTAATPLNVDVANDTVQFQLQSCNTTGLAPAYSVLMSDVLANQLDENSIAGPVVNINGAAATAGVDYSYTAPAGRGGTLQFELLTPVNPGQCVTVDYDIGFYTDFGPNQLWNNSVTVDEYWSLPVSNGQQYSPSGPAEFFMTNIVGVAPLSKVLSSPVGGEITIGEAAVYTITVPAAPINAVLNNVVVDDPLHAALTYVSATAVDGAGIPVVMVDTTVGQNVNLSIAQIPAGEQVVITLSTLLANNAAANAGVSFTNTAAYTYTGSPGPMSASSGALTIVEPDVAIAKTVSPLTPPNAGDILQYSVTLTASGGVVGDNFSDAFDLRIDDSLSLGLIYQAGTATVDGLGNTIADPVTNGGDGINTAQTLTWNLADATADIDVVEGTTVTVTYDVLVLDSVLAGQDLSNSATSQWTGLDTINVLERTGTGVPVENDYFTAPVTTTLTTLDNTTFTKTRLSDTYNTADANVRIGDLVDFELRLHLDEGSHNALVISDVLPQGLQFEQVVSINGDAVAPYNAVAPFTHNAVASPSITGNAALGDSTVTWTLGDVVNVSDNNAANDDFIIIYRARLLNNDVFTQTNNTTVTNAATLNYIIATGPASLSDNESVTLLQPDLSVSKVAAPAGGDTIIDAGELITYTVDVINSGTAPAYDTVVEDILPAGLRQGGVTTSSITLVNAGTTLPNLAPAYNPVTGTASWNFDSGAADAYSIPAGETLRIVYTVLADADLGPGLTLSNTATATLYYSFDDEAVPVNGNVTEREIYGPSNTATTTLTTPLPAVLLKETTQTTAYIGEQFTYRITVPAIPQTTALNDVRILDDLNVSAADLSFVSVSKIAGSQPWIPVNTGDAKNLVIEDAAIGIDIPAGDQAVIEITVVLDDSATNVSGLVFNNTADYTFNVTQSPGLPGTSGDMTIIGPDTVTLEKSGPATMNAGLPGTFTLNVQNTGSAPAWDLTITDQLPNPSPGGMCDAAPVNITAQIFEANGTTPVSAVLTQGTDYTTSFSADPGCILTVTMQSAVAAIDVGQRLIVTYEASIDSDSIGGTVLTNIAAATEWFSADTAGSGATGQIHTYTGLLTDGTVGTLDEQDAHTLVTEFPVLVFQKSVVNVTTGQDPGADAAPGDTLRYTLYVENTSPFGLSDFSVVDELDALNALPMFTAGSLNIIAAPALADTSNTNPNGGSNGTGLLDIRNLSLDAQGGANDSLQITFEVVLVPVIDSGTVVLNQATLSSFGISMGASDSDDPALIGNEDPTRTTITSAPVFLVQKTSLDITGDPAVLDAGDTLRYTLTVKNIGQENTVNTLFSDQIPSNTSYVAGSTRLNTVVVADPSTGVSALEAGMLLNAPENTTAGFMRADTDAAANNVATITFDVVVSPTVIDGTVISNQGFVSGAGAGSGVFPQQPSDDPDTALPDDPTLDVVGSAPVVDVLKTVAIQVDNGSIGVVDPGDILRYTITASNIGSIPATGVVLTDPLPAFTTYETNSTTLNGIALADIGVDSPIFTGIDISSSDLTPPLPSAGAGTLSAGQSAIVTFDVLVGTAAVPAPPAGTIISNQGEVSSNELPIEPTDSDGNDANGDQPTDVVVGNVQQLAISKQVTVVGGGAAQAGGQLEYVVRVTNIGSIAASNVVITDDLDALSIPGQMTYVNGSGLLNGLGTGVSSASPTTVTADYSTTYGDLPVAGVAELRFRVLLSTTLNIGDTVTNVGEVSWNGPLSPIVSDPVSIDIGGTPGASNLNGQVWHDTDFSNDIGTGEALLQNWRVELYRNNVLLANTLTDANGAFQFSGLVANLDLTNTPIGDAYELRYTAPGATASTATLGQASSVFTNGPQRISDIFAAPGASLQNLNLPRQPNGVVYDSVLRVPVPGVRLTMINQTKFNTVVPDNCFEDPNHQNQVTPAEGFYKFDLKFGYPECDEGDEYEIQIQPPVNGFVGTTSVIIPPVEPVTGAALNVDNCPVDAISSTAQLCEISLLATQQPSSVSAQSAENNYYLKFLFNGTQGADQVFNNHIPVDSEQDAAVSVSKVAGLLNVTRSQLVPYTITLNNTLPVPIQDLNVVDNFPAGFKYVTGSSRVDGVEIEPLINGRQLTWSNQSLDVGGTLVIKLLLVVGSGVGEGEYVNTAQVINSLTNEPFSGVASATVQVIPDPTFDCTDIIGKVFDDKNKNTYQDKGEKGIAGVQVATARGLRVTTDSHGRFHITCAIVPNEVRGSNFIMKLDDRTLPSGYRMTTENPRVQRATRGKMLKFNFGAAIHRVVRLDLADGVFEKGSTELRPQWRSRIDLLIIELQKDSSILRLSYLGENETESEVDDRLDAIEDLISERWEKLDCCYKLTIEKEVFWRKGKPSGRKRFE